MSTGDCLPPPPHTPERSATRLHFEQQPLAKSIQLRLYVVRETGAIDSAFGAGASSVLARWRSAETVGDKSSSSGERTMAKCGQDSVCGIPLVGELRESWLGCRPFTPRQLAEEFGANPFRRALRN